MGSWWVIRSQFEGQWPGPPPPKTGLCQNAISISWAEAHLPSPMGTLNLEGGTQGGTRDCSNGVGALELPGPR